MHSTISIAAAAAARQQRCFSSGRLLQQRQQQRMAARAAPQRGCVGRHLANRNEMCVSGSDSYALLFLYFTLFERTLTVHASLWS